MYSLYIVPIGGGEDTREIRLQTNPNPQELDRKPKYFACNYF